MAEKFGAGIKFVYVLQHWHSPKHLLKAVGPGRLDSDTYQALEAASGFGRAAVGTVFPIPTMPGRVLRHVGEAILDRAKQVAENRKISEVQTELLDGDPADCILKVLEQDLCDMIVMGMRGLGEVTGMLVGSVSYKINHLAPCTCITVRYSA